MIDNNKLIVCWQNSFIQLIIRTLTMHLICSFVTRTPHGNYIDARIKNNTAIYVYMHTYRGKQSLKHVETGGLVQHPREYVNSRVAVNEGYDVLRVGNYRQRYGSLLFLNTFRQLVITPDRAFQRSSVGQWIAMKSRLWSTPRVLLTAIYIKKASIGVFIL